MEGTIRENTWTGLRSETLTPKSARRNSFAAPNMPAQLDAVIWTQDPNKPNTLPRELRAYCSQPSGSRCSGLHPPRNMRVSCVVNTLIEERVFPWQIFGQKNGKRYRKAAGDRQNSFLMPCVYIFGSASLWPDIATLVCDRPAGPSPKFELKFDEEFLLKELWHPMGTRNALCC